MQPRRIGQALSNNHLGNVTALNKKNDNVIRVGKGECPEVKIEHGGLPEFHRGGLDYPSGRKHEPGSYPGRC